MHAISPCGRNILQKRCSHIRDYYEVTKGTLGSIEPLAMFSTIFSYNLITETSIRDGSGYQNGGIFGKVSKGL